MRGTAAECSPPSAAGGGRLSRSSGRTAALAWSLVISIGCGGAGETPTTAVPQPPPVSPPSPPLPPPPAPAGLHVSLTTADSITWTWTAVEGATAYEVQLSADEVFDDTDAIVTTTEASYTATGLSAESGRHLRVRAVAGTGNERIRSDWSAHVVGITLAPPLPREIGSPCPGVMVRGEPPERDDFVVRATLLIDWESGSGGSFDWVGPYFDEFPPPEVNPLAVNVAEWRVEILENTIRHTLEIEWPAFLESSLQFRSGNGGCVLPVLACSATVCELRP